MDNNFNIDANTMNKLNDMVKNGDVSKLISQIPPDMLQNFSSLMNNNTNIKKDSTDDVKNNENNISNNTTNNNNNNSFDFNNIDINTIMKMKPLWKK